MFVRMGALVISVYFCLLVVCFVNVRANTCNQTFVQIGCYQENPNEQMLLNDREARTKYHDGHLIDWVHFSKYLKEFACRCSAAASKKEFKYFSLRYFGLCYGSNNAPSLKKSKECVDRNYTACHESSEKKDFYCVGKANAEVIYKIVIGEFTQWTTWTACSATCGLGSRSKTRSCTIPNGRLCVGETKIVEECKVKVKCPVNGGFSLWTKWGECSKSCDTGKQTRHRRCNNPSPSNGGKDCHGLKIEERSCRRQRCCSIIVSHYKTICEHSRGILFCDAKRRLIIHYAKYGRHSISHCPSKYRDVDHIPCDSVRYTKEIKAKCNNKIWCSVSVKSPYFFNRRCPIVVRKYLKVKYSCIR